MQNNEIGEFYWRKLKKAGNPALVNVCKKMLVAEIGFQHFAARGMTQAL